MKQKDNKQLINRLNRIAGQIKGIAEMVESEKQCDEIVNQLLAARSAINMAGVEIVKNEICGKKMNEKQLKNIFKFN